MVKENTLIEIRWHGRGGQGAVTSAEMLAQAAIAEGKYAQAFPAFGPERRSQRFRGFLDAELSVHLCGLIVRKTSAEFQGGLLANLLGI